MFGKSSDQANLLLAGIDMLRGNWRLHGWTMVSDSYWTSDVLLGGLLSGVHWLLFHRLVSPGTLVFLPALSWTCVCLAGVLIAWRKRRNAAERWGAVLIILAAFGIPVMRGGSAPMVFLSGIHIVSILLALTAFAAGERALGESRAGLWLGVCFLALVLGLTGDPLVLIVGVAPLLAAVPLARAAAGPRRLVLAAVVLGAAGTAETVIAWNRHTGGFSISPLPLEFADFGQLAANIGVTIHCFLAAFSADFTGRQAVESGPEMAHLPMLMLGFAVLAVWLRRAGRCALKSRFGALDLAPVCLCAGALIDIAALIFSKRIEYEGFQLSSARYIYPAWIFIGILLARTVAGNTYARLLAIVAVLAALAFNGAAEPVSATPAISPAEQNLLGTLLSQKVKTGLGGYWEAALMQVASRNVLRVEGCVLDPAGRLIPFRNASKAFAMTDITAHAFFVIVRKPKLYFDQSDVRRNLGNPDHVQELPDFTLMFYEPGTHTEGGR